MKFRSAIAITLGVVLAASTLGPALASPAPAFVDVPGARILSSTKVTERTQSLTIATPSFTENTRVEVMLPTGYGDDPHRRWPVTYYLAGTSHDEKRFRNRYEGEQATASFESIVVIPKGDSSYWSDSYNYGQPGGGKYETFVSRQLIPLIDANFPTRAERAYRAIFGESMGGYGTMMMAARHPDLFVAAASLSGVLDSNYVPGGALITIAGSPDNVYGNRLTEMVRWRGHNPADLAGNLRDVALQIRVGNGVIGNGEGGTDILGCGPEISIVAPESESMRRILVGLDIPHVAHQYSFGCHSDPLIRREIRDAVPGLAAAFGTPSPATFDYRSIEPKFSVYDWSIAADPARALEFMMLSHVGAHGLTLAGSGTTTVTTPPLFAPSQSVDVVVAGGTTKTVTANAAGRITFPVKLGVPDTQQQYLFGSTTTVTIATATFVKH